MLLDVSLTLTCKRDARVTITWNSVHLKLCQPSTNGDGFMGWLHITFFACVRVYLCESNGGIKELTIAVVTLCEPHAIRAQRTDVKHWFSNDMYSLEGQTSPKMTHISLHLQAGYKKSNEFLSVYRLQFYSENCFKKLCMWQLHDPNFFKILSLNKVYDMLVRTHRY